MKLIPPLKLKHLILGLLGFVLFREISLTYGEGYESEKKSLFAHHFILEIIINLL